MNVNSTLGSYSNKETHACPKFSAHFHDGGILFKSSGLLKMSIV